MAKKSPEVEHIVSELAREFEHYKSRVLPKFHRRARGKLRRLDKQLRKLKPLKVKNHFTSMAEKELKSKLAQTRNMILNAQKKASADKGRIRSLGKEIRKLKSEVPALKKNVRSWSRVARIEDRKHKRVWKEWSGLQKRIAKEEKRKDKIVRSLQKYLQ